jgi:hypothetical protein
LPEYYGADGEQRMWRKSVRVSNDFDKARSEAHLLVRTRVTKQTPEMLAFDVPVRFGATRVTASAAAMTASVGDDKGKRRGARSTKRS